MHAIGIVCEYNPFHLGHRYQMEESRRLAGEDAAIVCVMSGDFVQRGEAAVFSKFARAEAACRCGADLVVELPLPWCLSSAEGFAAGAVEVLASLGCRSLSFGSEGGDLPGLKRVADTLLKPDTADQIRHLLAEDETLSFARARTICAERTLGPEAKLLTQPNNILAIEYLKAIQRLDLDLDAMAIARRGSAHDSGQTGEYLSAMELRKRMDRGEAVDAWIPRQASAVFERERAEGRFRDKRVIEAAVLSRLYRLTADDFDALPDASGGAGRRLHRAVWDGRGIADIVQRASGKRYTAARMRRMLLCAAFGICADDTKQSPPYIRVLAAGRKGLELLRRRGENADIPVLSRPAAVRKLGNRAEKVFSQGADAHALYTLQFVTIDDRNPNQDWETPPLFVENE